MKLIYVNFSSPNPDTVLPVSMVSDVAQQRQGLQGDLKLQCSTLILQLLQQVKRKVRFTV